MSLPPASSLSIEQADALLTAMQRGVPLVPRPFAALGAAAGLSEDATLDAIRAQSASGVLREISAVLEGSLLDHDSALVAATVPADRLEAVAEVVSAHPTVTHCYEREHSYNLWFTIAVPMSEGVERHLRLLEREADAGPFWPLRRTHTFKIGVNFSLVTQRNDTGVEAGGDAEPLRPGAHEQRLLRALQTPLPFVAQPFAALAATVGVTEDALLDFANAHLGGVVRRYVATLRHRKVGVRGNGMAVWPVPVEAVAEVGARIAADPHVSHCYAREAIPGFPYTLYSMIHGPDRAAVEVLTATIAADVGYEPRVLHSTREFKKTRLRYFLPELDAWRVARETA